MGIPNNKPLYKDLDLLDFLWKDDRRGMEILFRQYYQGLYQFVFLMIKRKELAEDTVQEVFVNLWKVRHNLQRNTRFKSYLYKACKNLALNKIKATKKMEFTTELIAEIPSYEADILQLLENRQLSEHLSLIIESLPPKRRLIFHMSRFQEMTYREIADHLDISIKTVENQMSAALKTLRKDLEQYL